MTPSSEESLLGPFRRAFLYQRERFPVLKTGILLLAFTAASISVSAHLAGRPLPGAGAFAAAWAAVFLIFFQMRAADETKDFDLDARWRPERPIHRGLVDLRSVQTAGVAAFPLAALAAWSWAPGMLVPLVFVWIWLALMTVEFMVPGWLVRHPLAYLVSHMAIMPLIDLLATSAEWIPAAGSPPEGLWSFLLLSFANGVVLEIGRKTWAPASEREGVETYSSLLGPSRSAWTWLAVVGAAFVLQGVTASIMGTTLPVLVLGAGAFAFCAYAGISFALRPDVRGQKRIEDAAGAWVLVCYAALGAAPHIDRLVG